MSDSVKQSFISAGISSLIALILTELTLTLLFPVDDPYQRYKGGVEAHYIESQFEPNQRYTFYTEPDLPGMYPQASFTTNNYGFRGRDLIVPKPASEYRIFMVGGSTTECLFLDDTCAVGHVLETKLNELFPDSLTVCVQNAGKSGDRSYDHIAMISHRIIHLEPDMIILYAGYNDLVAGIYSADYLHFAIQRSPEMSFAILIKYLLSNFQLPRRLYYLYQGLLRKPADDELRMQIRFTSHYGKLIQLRKSHPVQDIAPRVDLRPYARNLRTLVGIAKAHNIVLVFVTQATAWNSTIDNRVSERLWGTYQNGITYREDRMDKALEAYNDAMRRLAAEYDIALIDLAREIPKSIDYFYDDCHFNVRGVQEAASLLGNSIAENLSN